MFHRLLSRRANPTPARKRRLTLVCSFAAAFALPLVGPVTIPQVIPVAVSNPSVASYLQAQTQAQAQSGGAIQMKASRVEANSNTGVVTAIGNVRIDYPSRDISATSAQAQYYSREQRIVLSGDVDVLQEGNTLKAETVTYLITEGRFVATPGSESQVEAVYILPDDPAPTAGLAPAPPAPLAVPAVPDELPAELSPIEDLP